VHNATYRASLIERIYNTVLEPESWPTVLEDICGIIGASSAFLYTPDETLPVGDSLYVSYGLPRTFQEAVRTQTCGLDVWKEQAQQRGISRGTLYTDEMLLPEHVLIQTDHYNMHLRPHGIHRVMATALSVKEAGSTPMVALSLYRPRQAGAFTPANRQTYLEIAPHLRRANDIHWRLRQAELRHCADASVLDRLAMGVVLLNPAGEVLHCNGAAVRMLRSGDGVEIRKRRLHALLPDQAAKLTRVIGNVCRSGGGYDTDAGGFVFIDRPSGGRPWSLLVAPLPLGGRIWTGPSNAVAAVFLHDQEFAASGVQVVGKLYGLTAAECRLGKALAQGSSLSEIAADLRLSKATLRTQLAAVFAKTGTTRQAELMRLLISQLVQAR